MVSCQVINYKPKIQSRINIYFMNDAILNKVQNSFVVPKTGKNKVDLKGNLYM